jgi:TetR/AcrR family transcriptional repressor of nem operon
LRILMGRPRQFDPAEVDEALLGVFWSRGYAGTSIEELTEATGLLRGSLYAAYGSKEDMFRAAMKRYVADLAAALSTDKRGLDGAQHVLETVVRLTARDPERRGCLIINTIPESHALSTETQAQLQGGLKAMRALLRARLREAQAEAGTDLDLDPLAAMLFASSVAIRVLGRAGHDRRLLEDIATGAIEAARHRFETDQTTQPKE